MSSYYKVKSGEWIYPVSKGYKMMCCDCGLVHVIDFEPINKSRVRLRVTRNNRATANARRAKQNVTQI